MNEQDPLRRHQHVQDWLDDPGNAVSVIREGVRPRTARSVKRSPLHAPSGKIIIMNTRFLNLAGTKAINDGARR